MRSPTPKREIAAAGESDDYLEDQAFGGRDQGHFTASDPVANYVTALIRPLVEIREQFNADRIAVAA